MRRKKKRRRRRRKRRRRRRRKAQTVPLGKKNLESGGRDRNYDQRSQKGID